MDIYNHKAYGQELTRSLKLFQPQELESFFEATNSDTLYSIDQKLSSINYPCLVAIDGSDSDYRDNEAEALLKKPQYFFMFLKPAQSDDSVAIIDAQKICSANAEQVMFQMLQESGKHLKGLTGLQIDTFSIRSIGPIGDNLFGVILSFNLEYGIVHKKDLDFWV
jgi:hypothetical protein